MKRDLYTDKRVNEILIVLLWKLRARLFKYLFELFYMLKLEKIPILPISIDVEPTNRCNFRCPYCQLTYWSKKNIDLSLSSFKTILAQFPNLNFLKLQGIGEPLLCKDFIDMLQYAESKYINIDFTTNGSIKSKRLIDIVEKLNRTQIRFSIDGANEDNYNKMRPEGKIKSIIEFASQLVKARASKSQPKIILWMVLTKYNINEISELIHLAKKMNIECVGLQTTLHDWAKTEVKELNKTLKCDDNSELFTNNIKMSKNLAKSLGIELIVENSLLTKKKKCKWPFTSAFISANGDVVPCCWLSDSDTVKMGNVFEEDFNVIWNSKEYRELRKSIKKHKLKAYCKSCYLEI